MSADWTWLFLDAHGEPMEGEGLATTGFPTQSDAESYLGESWRAAFGLTVTIIWLYIELLRILAILRGND